MINYKCFTIIFKEALNYKDFDMFVAERGWQDWMDGLETTLVVNILNTIWDVAKEKNRIKYVRCELIKCSRAEFVRNYSIPIRTVEDWDAEKAYPAEYIERVLLYAMLTDYLCMQKGITIW